MVAQEEMGNMENECCYAEAGYLVFLYMDSAIGYGNYVDVYIWDCDYYPYSYDRFVICDGYCMPEELENTFLLYIHDRFLSIDKNSMIRFCANAIDTFPQWHFCHYSNRDINQALEHLYYASHRSGVKEILYKADLANIAFNVDMLPHYNMLGTTPSTIINNSFPLRLLRILNNGMIDELFDEESSDLCCKVFKRYSGYFEHNLPSKSQWRYLIELYLNDGKFIGRDFSRSFYNMLSGCENSRIIDEYKTFIGIVDELEMWGYYEIPAPEQLKDDIKALNRFREYEINENVIKKYSIRNGRESMAYAYSNEKYEVVFPKSPMEMCREAAAQRNCLLNYVNGHADKLTTVLFVRKCESHNKPFVTMEVKDNVVVQALARFNRVPDSDVQAFVKEYANVKGFYLIEEAEKYFDYQEDFFF